MRTLIVATLALFIGLGCSHKHGHQHDHHNHSAHANHKVQNIDPNKKFVPDEDLKVRMDKLAVLMTELDSKKNTPKALADHGTKFTDVVADIFRTCKLEPEADAAIHPALGNILQGAEDLKEGKYEVGRQKIHQALLDYGNLFTHEGWKYKN